MLLTARAGQWYLTSTAAGTIPMCIRHRTLCVLKLHQGLSSHHSTQLSASRERPCFYERLKTSSVGRGLQQRTRRRARSGRCGGSLMGGLTLATGKLRSTIEDLTESNFRDRRSCAI